MNTENIQKFLMPPDEGGAYTDEKLAALLAHAQDGKLSYTSCCCLVGSVTSDHALKGFDENILGEDSIGPEHAHIHLARRLEFGRLAEIEFFQLGFDKRANMLWRPLSAYTDADKIRFMAEDAKRRERLIPLILTEMERRELRAFLNFQIKQEHRGHSTDTANAQEMYRDQGVK